MARRKKVKEEKKKFQYSNELFGLLLILLSITGLGGFGVVGEWIRKCAVVLFGSWYLLLLGLLFILGIIMIAKRGKVNFFSGRMIGVYSLVLSILLFAHVNYINDNDLRGKDILTDTMDNIETVIESNADINTGGGIIGSFCTWGLVSLIEVEGTVVVIIAVVIFGMIMVFDVTLTEVGHAIAAPFKKMFSSGGDEVEKSSSKEKILGGIEEEEEKPIDKRVVITSVEDLEPKKEVIIEKEPITKEVTNEVYIKPPIELLDLNKNKNNKANSTEVINQNTKTIERVFGDFGMTAKIVEVHVGPAVTQYEMILQRGTKVNKVLSISREIALALAAKEVRIEAPIPGKNTVGIEVPNQNIIPVSMREIMDAIMNNPKLADSKLLAPLGRDIMGNVKYVEINKTPHMLVAGATGSGKSVCINNIIVSILMRTTPEEVKMVLVDPKKVEFNVYDGIPHLLTPVVTDPKKASVALQKIVMVMEERYETFKNSGTKNIGTYNEYVEKELKKNPNCGLTKLPFILVIIDELADLMIVAAKEVEESIMRITQLARAAGIHLIVATQRPSTDVITGVVKANIPTRVSFAVSSSIDSRTILDMTGAEKLLGKGDMLFKPMDENAPTRIQGSYVSDGEIARVVEFIKERSHGPRYSDDFEKMTSNGSEESSGGSAARSEESNKDVLYDEVLNYAIRMGQISASLIQRKYSIGYNRAARLMDMFEERGIVGPAKGSKPRDVLVKYDDGNNGGEE